MAYNYKTKGARIMRLHCVVTRETEIGLVAFYTPLNSCINLASYIPNINAKTFTIFETKKRALEVVEEWNKDFRTNGMQKVV